MPEDCYHQWSWDIGESWEYGRDGALTAAANVAIVPDFESARLSSPAFLDAFFQSPTEQSQLNSFTNSIYTHTSSTTFQPSETHVWMDRLAQQGRLMRHYTQNIDRIEYFLPSLDSKTVRLHGRVDRARCARCNWTCDIEPTAFQSKAMGCEGPCLSRQQARELRGKRSIGVGLLRPDVLLYGGMNPAEEEIFTCLEEDIRRRPDLVIVVGTRLLIPSARDLAKGLCDRTLETGGKTVWVNKSPKSCGLNFSLVWQGDCDDFAALD